MSKETENDRFVVTNPTGGWDVKKTIGERASSHYETQAEAELAAKTIVKGLGGGEVRIQIRDTKLQGGQMQAGTAPTPPHGRKL
jgi:Uncharacterized protein conserved in bacteria (DUF2188)